MSVTCILPVYNGERFLAEALESVLDQNVPDLDVLVVDDGSTDGTPAVLERFGSRIRVVRQENAGVSAARNRGLDEARGPFIAFQDCDDLWMPGKLERQLAALRQRPELDLCLGLVQNFWMDELAAEETAYRGSRFAEPAPGYLLQAMVARRSVFDRVGRFDTSLGVGEDNDWFLRVRDAGLADEVLPEVLVRRRLHLGNLTRKDLASREAILRNMKASLDRRRSGGRE
jgi:glycosyltransferase involved in cell wall biosynthesis